MNRVGSQRSSERRIRLRGGRLRGGLRRLGEGRCKTCGQTSGQATCQKLSLRFVKSACKIIFVVYIFNLESRFNQCLVLFDDNST